MHRDVVRFSRVKVYANQQNSSSDIQKSIHSKHSFLLNFLRELMLFISLILFCLDKNVSPLSGGQDSDSASCENATVSGEVNTDLHSPAGQEKKETTKPSDNLSSERSNLRATPAKIRLAANFSFPLNRKK